MVRHFWRPSSSSAASSPTAPAAGTRGDMPPSNTPAPAPSGIENLRINPIGLTEVYSSDDPQVDIVLVHGLNGSPQGTWTAPNGVFWPAQLLPQSLGKVRARVSVYGYNANVYAFGGKSATSDYILQHAQTLITTLEADRYLQDAEERPIIWVCHSLGGILVKKTLDYSSDITGFDNEGQRSIYVSTYGIIFLGTPHTGSDAAKWGKMVESMCSALLPRKLLDTEPNLINTLKTQSETLQNINSAFVNIDKRFHLAFFHEALKTDFGATIDFVVDQTSAAPPAEGVHAGIEATHSGMCKYESPTAPGYTLVVSNLKKYAQEAPNRIPARWAEERENRARARLFVANELTGANNRPGAGLTPASAGSPSHGVSQNVTPSHSIGSLPPRNDPSVANEGLMIPYLSHDESDAPSNEPAEPLFIVPSGYRPNKIFVGMKRELDELDERLFDPEMRNRGSACVLLWCLPGGGKTHLARQYIFTRQDKFPGGVFWVRAKSKGEIALGFWDIAQKAGLKDVQDPRTARYEEDHEVFIRNVKAWFEGREGWLLVFDGVTIDSEEEISRLQAFLPDSKNSSIILTSVDKSLANRHRLLDPLAVKVMTLSDDDARQLLFDELNIRRPDGKQIAQATDLIRKVEKLPLAIHAIGHVLNETHEPLVKYHIRPYSADPKLSEPYTEIMLRLQHLKQVEALNLMFILCFFREHLPFELVQLGVGGIAEAGIRVKAKMPGSDRPQLNDTFRILMRYALIERNERTESEDGASQRSNMTTFAESIDTLKIHSVIQSFFLETLNADGRLAFWLGVAVKVFQASYQGAHERIQKGCGLINDYREYEVHGKRLLQHVDRNRAKHPVLEKSRTALERLLSQIQAHLRDGTPGSSSEGIERQVVNKISVFDRTSSSSSAGPDTPRDSISGITTWGLDAGKEPVMSPVRIRRGDVHAGYMPPQLVQAPAEDTGYQTDFEMPESSSQMMTPNPSRDPQRRSPVDEKDGGQWQVVKRKTRGTGSIESLRGPSHRTIERKQQKRRYNQSVSGWRHMKPGYPEARVERLTIERTDTNRPGRTRTRPRAKTGTSEAELRLARIHRQSPPAVRQAGDGQGFDRGGTGVNQSGGVSHTSHSGISYADMTAGRATRQTPSTASESQWMSPGQRSTQDAMSEDDHWGNRGPQQPPAWVGSGDSAHPTSHHFTSSHAGEQANQRPTHGRSTHSSPGPTPRLTSPNNIVDPRSRPPPETIFEPAPSPYPTGPIRGRPNPRPIEELYDVRTFGLGAGQDGPMSSSSTRTVRPTSNFGLNPVNPYQTFVGPRPTGYTSQPMSREGSNHSIHTNRSGGTGYLIADSEPPRSPPPFTSPSHSVAMPTSPLDGPNRPHERSPLSRPTQLSPEHRRTNSSNAPRLIRTHDLNAMGSWTVTSPTSATPTMTMSRSSSGPGIIAQGRYIRFGDQEEISIDEAELRAAMQRENLRVHRQMEAHAVADGRLNTPDLLAEQLDAAALPYPLVSQIPSTQGEVRAVMAESQEMGRRRAVSDGGVGVESLGVRPLGLEVMAQSGEDSVMLLSPPAEEERRGRRG